MSPAGRMAFALAAWAAPPYKGARVLARMNDKGYVSFSAKIAGERIHLGKHSFIGDDVVLYQNEGEGKIALGDGSSVNQACVIETGQNGSVLIGRNTHIQPRCQLSAYLGDLIIGDAVQIAPNCAFYPYNHGFAANMPIMEQALSSKGGIIIEDDVWLSYGVVVLDGVKIGKGAVIGAGAVVLQDVPPGAIAAGIPAKVIGMRENLAA